MAVASAPRRGFFCTQVWAMQQLSSTVRWGKRLKCWNTMPTLRRICSMRLTSWVMATPLTTMRPS